MDRFFVVAAGVFGFLSVAAGAFGAHALRNQLSADLLAIFQTAVQYHQIHALALLATAWLLNKAPGWPIQTAGWLFIVGILVFSGSLYALALSGVRVLGAITPIGGLAFLGGWVLLAWSGLRL
mgnify:CR=1 FL=1